MPGCERIALHWIADLPIGLHPECLLGNILWPVSPLGPGYHQVTGNGRNEAGRELRSGIYIARLVAPDYTRSIKMVLLKWAAG